MSIKEILGKYSEKINNVIILTWDKRIFKLFTDIMYSLFQKINDKRIY